jgi:cellulose synthase/poly-beta-1,6-N-acetylglucosamine synthase-like glycosyltransferase/peptidoglycan/xylan/chitin deacetylase (PgdA/CDA1 family)/spore germination protein YaaH
VIHTPNKLLKYLFSSLFPIGSPNRIGAAGAVGGFITAIALQKYDLYIMLLLALIFKINIISMVLGYIITRLIPANELLIYYMGDNYNSVWGILIGTAEAVVIFLLFKICIKRSIKRKEQEPRSNFIFIDMLGIRWPFVKCFGLWTIIIVFLTVSVFSARLIIRPKVPSLSLDSIEAVSNNGQAKNKDKTKLEELKAKLLNDIETKQINDDINKEDIDKRKVYAYYYTGHDESSRVSLMQNIDKIDTLMPGWFHIEKDSNINITAEKEVDEFAKEHNVDVLPIVDNIIDGNRNVEYLHQTLSSSQNRSRFIQQIYSLVKDKYKGINIDFKGIGTEDADFFIVFMAELYELFHYENLIVTLNMRPNDVISDYTLLQQFIDYGIIPLWDDRGEASVPGPLASEEWIKKVINSNQLPMEKTVISLGNYGYDWIDNSEEEAQLMTFTNVMNLSNELNLQVNWDKNSKNPYIKYSKDGKGHTLWFLDGVTTYNQLSYVLKSKYKNIAVWSFGFEDTTIWKLIGQFKKGSLLEAAKELTDISAPEWVFYEGMGDIIRVADASKNGIREIDIDSSGFINSEKFHSFPIPMKAKRYGNGSNKEIVLTFDDGPDRKYTSSILDILKKYDIKAVFFILGTNGVLEPELIKRIYDEGHEIGNHTFSHPDIAEDSDFSAHIEMNANQRLIQSLTGHSTLLYRPPYNNDKAAITQQGILPVLRIQDIGYTLISQGIDPWDWNAKSSDEIYRGVMEQLTKGNIVLLHDSGGDRGKTIEALPKIIETLKAEGYNFTTISGLLGKDKNELMPEVDSKDKILEGYDKLVFEFIRFFHGALFGLFLSIILIGSIKLIFLIIFALKQKFKEGKNKVTEINSPFASVIIPTYNEEKVISKTILAALNNDYENLEIIVVDDGSKDSTAAIVRESFKDISRVRLICKTNGGKASALNEGILNAKGEIIVAIDADTIIGKNSISLLIKHFKNRKVAAVSGNVKVGNVHNLTTLWQHLEYVTGFNLERRAFSELNCVTVVPGAIGAWRKDALLEVGLFKDDTLAEDTDITLSLLLQGYQVDYDSKAVAYTESPDNLKGLIKQRYRWTYGTLQCLWKYKEVLLDPRHKALAFVAMPNMWLFQYVFQVLSPIVDIYFAASLLFNNPNSAIKYYLIFLAIDYFTTTIAFLLDKEKLLPIILLFLQRIIYRMLMVFVIYKAVVSAFKGISVGWNKLNRTGSVRKE